MQSKKTETGRRAGQLPDEKAYLTHLIRAIFPHDSVPITAYERTADIVLREAAASPWAEVKLHQGLRSLEALSNGTFIDMEPDEAHPMLMQIQHTPFFGFVRQNAVVNLYEDEEVWATLGYEGPSFDKGGYIDRGFNDLDWLPEPRIEEYEGEPLAHVISPIPGASGAADVRPAAVPVGQNRQSGQPNRTGRSGQ